MSGSIILERVADVAADCFYGELLKASGAEFARDGMRVSQDVLFVEPDGLWVHLLEGERRGGALPRFLYEQARKTKSFELKVAAPYAGKAKVAPGRYERGGPGSPGGRGRACPAAPASWLAAPAPARVACPPLRRPRPGRFRPPAAKPGLRVDSSAPKRGLRAGSPRNRRSRARMGSAPSRKPTRNPGFANGALGPQPLAF